MGINETVEEKHGDYRKKLILFVQVIFGFSVTNKCYIVLSPKV